MYSITAGQEIALGEIFLWSIHNLVCTSLTFC